jgi:hypothetical protein
MTHKEFCAWLEGYLHGKLENRTIEIAPIVEKLNSVKEESDFNIDKWKHLSKSSTKNPIIPVNPIKYNDDDDDLGLPPKIVM